MTAYYNELDPFAAHWLRNLIRDGHIAPGDVDERSIVDVRPSDLAGYTQCHFFAGIGVWSAALRAADWPDARRVWTGSCPCQPFSAAGKGGGFDDERHLWPALQWLTQQCRPDVVFGEQVASKDGLGWLDLVSSDLEAMGYACGAVPFPAAGIGAPHIRQRLYWVADARSEYLRGEPGERAGAQSEAEGEARQWQRGGYDAGAGRAVLSLADAADQRHKWGGGARGWRAGPADDCTVVRLADADSRQRDGLAEFRGAVSDGQDAGRTQGIGEPEPHSGDGGLADANGGNASAEREQRGGEQRQQPQDAMAMREGLGRSGVALGDANDSGLEGRPLPAERSGELTTGAAGMAGHTGTFWSDADWIWCRDGKYRPVEPGTFPLAHGLARGMGTLGAELRQLAEVAGLDGKSLAGAKAHRIGSLRGYGNAIVKQQAEEFIRAYVGQR